MEVRSLKGDVIWGFIMLGEAMLMVNWPNRNIPSAVGMTAGLMIAAYGWAVIDNILRSLD